MAAIDHRGIDHVGVVVKDLDASLHYYQEDLGLVWDGKTCIDPLQGARIAFVVDRTTGLRLELLEPWGENSPLRGPLRRRERLVHLCYRVPDVASSLDRVCRLGGRVISRPKPAVAFGGRSVAFALTRDREVLELVEAAGGPESGRETAGA
jgi:methylmalonyl-CoA/ethylmalonyl-CoA epimerase